MSHLETCRETVENCSDTEAHYQAADALKIPGCLPNRRSQVEAVWHMGNADEQSQVIRAALCVSEHCLRCQTLRVFDGMPPLDNNAFLRADIDAEVDDAIRASMTADLNIMSMLYRNIPAPPADDLKAWGTRFSLAARIPEFRATMLLHPDATDAIIEQSLFTASAFHWDNEEIATKNFYRIAHTLVDVLINKKYFIEEEDCRIDSDSQV